jgi:hypothetical protein
MEKNGKTFSLIIALLMLLVFASINLTPLVTGQATKKNLIIHIVSPIENQTYHTNKVLLNFTMTTNINEFYPNSSAVFTYDLDGTALDLRLVKLGFNDPNAADIGWWYLPLPPYISTTIDVADGNHLIWVQIGYYTGDPYDNGPYVNLSQIVSFSVDNTAPSTSPNLSFTPTPSPTPGVPELSWLIVLPLLLSVFAAAVKLRHRKNTSMVTCQM